MKRTTVATAALIERQQTTGPDQTQFAAFLNQRYFDLMAGLNLLAAQPEVDAKRLGCAN